MAGTDIEKKSLEAHVELCAERYENLDTKLNSLESRMDRLEGYLVEIKDSLISNKSDAADSSGPYKTMIAIGTTVLGAMIGALVTLVVHIK